MARKAKAKASTALTDTRSYRLLSGFNQVEFWGELGVTQSGGSRYEQNRRIPKPLALLMVLKEQGIISAEQLEAAKEIVEASKR